MLYPTHESWVEAKRLEFTQVADKNNPLAGVIFLELVQRKSFKVVRVSDQKVLFITHHYKAAYNKASAFKCEVVIN